MHEINYITLELFDDRQCKMFLLKGMILYVIILLEPMNYYINENEPNLLKESKHYF
jgi:hypothetical protein